MLELEIKRPGSLLSVELHREITEEQLRQIRSLIDDGNTTLEANLRGVLADFEDGGLTEEEALSQMTDIVDRSLLPRREGIDQYQAEDR
jgi:hypothetical protein